MFKGLAASLALLGLTLPAQAGEWALEEWLTEPDVKLVAIRGTGPRAFCAGGDIRFLHECASTGTAEAFGGRHLEAWRLRGIRESKHPSKT